MTGTGVDATAGHPLSVETDESRSGGEALSARRGGSRSTVDLAPARETLTATVEVVYALAEPEQTREE